MRFMGLVTKLNSDQYVELPYTYIPRPGTEDYGTVTYAFSVRRGQGKSHPNYRRNAEIVASLFQSLFPGFLIRPVDGEIHISYRPRDEAEFNLIMQDLERMWAAKRSSEPIDIYPPAQPNGKVAESHSPKILRFTPSP